MTERLLRFIAGIVLVVTIPLTIGPFLILWVITGDFYLVPILNWIILGEFDWD